ncbi:hypothetical protein Aph02nite_85660 [Actinoplanes philippinensis]|uniref:Uncharacterized protein n=1 Tax=Actinoplanes philippinensis TaxID=35752 RepID=A0A1I2LVK5_9ACTN|nr:hypothetical protein [Actinoplanes philippinensis]GIE82616.1 hypothetical protein Aph02nite_85660 [Actinoplanes philippinensis]SFF81497.1 hypothetical protein SAMN05421541_12383 [Actinoplanes philippinensis]
MADQQPGDTTPAAGMPDPTRFAGPGEPPTADVPGWWSGAAPVPEAVPRRSLWSRMVDRVNGAEPADPADDRTAIPAVDPWADQDTPVWPDAYTTPAAPLPPTRIENPAPPATRITGPAPSHPAPSHPAPTGLTEPAPPRPAATPASASAANPAATRIENPAAHGTAAAPGTTPSSLPAPGTYPPPAGGTGLPPLIPPKIRAWGRRAAAAAPDRLRSLGQQAAAKGQQVAAETPDRLRSLGQQAAAKSQQAAAMGHQIAAKGQQAAVRGQQAAAGAPGRFRLLTRRRAPSGPPPRIPVQPRPVPPRPVPPRAPLAIPRPRRRRRFRRLGLFLTVLLALAGAYWYVPGLRQYPVTAVLPESFSDLNLRDTEAGRRAAQRLADQLQGAEGNTFAGIYTDDRGKRVTVFGVTGLRLTPATDVDAQLSRLADTLKLKDVESFDLGEFGAHQRCGTGRLDDTSVVACTWADHGSLATVLLTRRSLSESAILVAGLRKTVLAPA